GKVSSFGIWPRDVAEEVVKDLYATELGARKFYQDSLARQKMFRFVMSSCGTSPGDSGSPVVDKDGNVIGVHSRGTNLSRGVNTTSFHVHLSELKAFLG